MPSCSVVIVSYYSGPVLFACLKSVLSQHGLAEVIVVDNGNPPSIVARLQQMTLSNPKLRVLSGQGNVGYAKGANLGAKSADGDFLLLLNPDCMLPPEALVDTLAAFEEFPDAVVAGAVLLNADSSEQLGGRMPLLDFKSGLIYALGADTLSPLPLQTYEVPATSSAFMCIRTEDFHKLHGFDEGFFLYLEDMDLCRRVHELGGKIICVPKVKVAHLKDTTREVTSGALQWNKAKALTRYFKKHFQKKYFPGAIPLIQLGITLRFALQMVIGSLCGRFKFRRLFSQTPSAKRLMILASGFAELPETQDLHGKTILVTGATSQTGLCVLHRLLASGAAVLAMSRNNPVPFFHERLRWVRSDLTDKDCNLSGYYVDIAVHCAPLWYLPEAITMLAEAEVKRIVAFGSTSVFGKALSRNVYEKNMVEKLRNAEDEIAARCKEKNIAWTLLRPTLIYGVGLDVGVTSLAKFIHKFGFFPVYPPASGRRQPVHADDLALAMLQVLRSATSEGRSYNLSGGEVLSYRDMIARLFTLCGKKTRIINATILPFILDAAGLLMHKKHINGEIARRMNDDLVFFHDEAKKDFGFSPRPFLSGGIRDIEGF